MSVEIEGHASYHQNWQKWKVGGYCGAVFGIWRLAGKQDKRPLDHPRTPHRATRSVARCYILLTFSVGDPLCIQATMPHGVTPLLFVLLAGLLVAVARGQSDYYDQYLDTQVRILHLVSVEFQRYSQDEGSDVDKRAWNSGFNSGMGKRAWNSKSHVTSWNVN